MKNLELMQGFPASPDGQVTLANWRKPPFNKWSFAHVREIVPSAAVGREPGAVRPLPAKPADFSDLVAEFNGHRLGFADFLDYTDTDGLVILHQGTLSVSTIATG